MFNIEIEPGFRLELLQLSHAKSLYVLTEENRAHLRQWLPWLDQVKTEEDTRQFIKTTLRQFSDDLGFQAALIYQDRIVGISGYHPLNRTNHFGSLGYWLCKAYEGQGLITKATAKIIEMGFGELRLNKIMITCAAGNRKSRAVARRLGFKQDGVLRQHEWLYDRFVDGVVYSLLKKEFEQSRAPNRA